MIQAHVPVRLAIDFSAMPDLDHDHFAALVTSEVDDSIVALADALLVLAPELLTARGSWIGSQAVDATEDAPAILLGGRFRLFDGRGLDEEFIDVHASCL